MSFYTSLCLLLTLFLCACSNQYHDYSQSRSSYKKNHHRYYKRQRTLLKVSPRYKKQKSIIKVRYAPLPEEDHSYTYKNALSPVVFYAINMIGIPYIWGGETPKKGFDCSGFINYIYQHAEKKQLPRTAAELYHVGMSVHKIRPGDLVFFHTDAHAFISHVGMYIGGHNFVHSPRTGSYVRIESINQPYWRQHFLGAKRILLAKKSSLSDKHKLLGLNRNYSENRVLHIHTHTTHTTRRRHR